MEGEEALELPLLAAGAAGGASFVWLALELPDGRLGRSKRVDCAPAVDAEGEAPAVFSGVEALLDDEGEPSFGEEARRDCVDG